MKSKSINRIPKNKKLKYYGHIDFVAAKNVEEVFYGPLLQKINEIVN